MNMKYDKQIQEAQEDWELGKVKTIKLIQELKSRGYKVLNDYEYDEASGLMYSEYYENWRDPEANKLVEASEVYKRMSGGW